VSYNRFVEYYSGRRRTVYQDAADSLLVRGVERKDSYLATFVKAEKINFTAKADPAPRVIQPRHPRYNVAVGVFLKPIEHQLYSTVDRVFGEVTIMKGHNAQESGGILHGKWSSFRHPVAVGLDASRFDQHVSPDTLSWEHTVYEMFYRGADKVKLRALLSWQLRNRGFGRASDGLIKYIVDGCRMSGDMNTGLGNCIIMCALIWAYCCDHGLKAKLANNGDDCVLFLEAADLAKLRGINGWFRTRGFTMKMEEPVYHLEQVEFCQTQPVWTPEGWLMVRKHGSAMSKDVHTVFPLDNEGGAMKWLKAISDAGMALTGGIPVQQEFYRALGRNARVALVGAPQLESGFMRLAAGMQRTHTDVHPMTRVSYWRAFGVLPDVQESLEQWLATTDVVWTPPQPQGKHIPSLTWVSSL